MALFWRVAIFGVVFAIVFRFFVMQAMRDTKVFGQALHESTRHLTSAKVVIVTGGNSGLGYETIRYLVQDGALIIMAVRDVAKGKAAFEQLYHEGEMDNTKAKKPQVIVMELDLGSLKSVRAFAKEFKAQFPKLDVLINNAGIMALPERTLTVDGFEAQMGTNHLGHFLLTSLLMPVMAPNGRIVNHASSAYQFAASNNFVTEDLFSEKSYSAWSAYGNSKAANLMFTFELNRRLNASSNSRHLTAYAVHPGYSATNLQNGRFPGWEWANQNLAMSAELGCLSQVYAAVGTDARPSHQSFIGPKYQMFGAPAETATSAFTADADSMRALWEISTIKTGAEWSI